MCKQCSNSCVNGFFLENIEGNSSLLIFQNVMEFITFYNLTMSKVSTNGVSIFQLTSSTFNLISSEIVNFYPILFYSSFSVLNVKNCHFNGAFDNKNDGVQIIVLYFEDTNSFNITNNLFESFSNDNSGIVNNYIIISIYKFF